MPRDLLHRLKSLLRRSAIEQELDDELRFHLEKESEKLTERGLSAAEAARHARIAFGGVEQVKEQARDARGTRVFEDLLQDSRYALRVLRKSPAFALAVITTLGLGIGATSALFNIAYAVMLRSMPVANPQELVVVARDPNRPYVPHSRPDYLRLTEYAGQTLQGVAASHEGGTAGFNVVGQGGVAPADIVKVAFVSGTYFSVLGVQPEAGRLLAKEDETAPGANPYVVLDYRFWHRQLGGDPAVLGRTVRLNDALCTVVGVTRSDFHGTRVGSTPDVYVPLTLYPAVVPSMRNNWDRPGRQWLTIVARLRPGVTVGQAESQVTSLLADRAAELSRLGVSWGPGDGADRSWTPTLLPGAQGYSPLQTLYGKPLVVLLAAAGLLLLLACSNVASLLLSRATSRERELAMRLAVGASRGRIVRQLLTESLLLATAGGLVGVAIGIFGAEALVRLLSMQIPDLTLDVAPNAATLATSLAVTMAAGLLFGLAPALRASRTDLAESLKRRRGVFSRLLGQHVSARELLVAAQVSLSLVLLVGITLLTRSFVDLQTINPGFARDGVLLVTVQPTQHGYQGSRARDFYEKLRERVATLPGVRAVGLSDETPLGGGNSGGTASAPGRFGLGPVEAYGVSAGYFEAVGIRLVAGRDLSPADEASGTARVALITESLAQRLFPGDNPINRRFSRTSQYDARHSFEVIGVVEDARYFGLRTQPVPTAYLPVQSTASNLTLSVRTDSPHSLIPAVRREVAAIDSAVPVLAARTIKQRLEAEVAQERLLSTVVGSFGILALALVGVGIHGVLVLAVTSRTKEIGICAALGAGRADIIRRVVGNMARLLAAGVIVGLVCALVCMRFLRTFLHGVPALEFPSLLIACGVLGTLTLFASGVPVLRAARVNPVEALRRD